MFVSIAGTPSCGKTYFLASMTWQLRRTLPKHFATTFNDADPEFNLALNEYENQQFFNENPDQIVKLAKTEEHGHLYDQVHFDDQTVSYPRPFLFSISPNEQHPSYSQSRDVARLLCLYDNAGESFEPGKDDVANPVTRHIARAQVLMFCFDPTQDPRVRQKCKAATRDPQVVTGLETRRQESFLHEMFHRVRRHAAIHADERTSRPVVIIVTKYDVWSSLYGEERLRPPWVRTKRAGLHALDMPYIEDVSSQVRQLLWDLSPEIVSAAESFSNQVIFIPVSATGCSPELDPATGRLLGIRPRDINPMWAEVPLLVALARWGGGLIPYTRWPPDAQRTTADEATQRTSHTDADSTRIESLRPLPSDSR